jgi:hypothetical protein
MGPVTGNTVVGKIVGEPKFVPPPNPSIVGRNYILVTTDIRLRNLSIPPNDSIHTEDPNRFQGGLLRDKNGLEWQVWASTVKAGYLEVLVLDQPGTLALPPNGSFKLIDDDHLKDGAWNPSGVGDDVPAPNTDELDDALMEAYVTVRYDVGDQNDSVPFRRNVEDIRDVMEFWNSSRDLSPDFWVAYILGAFQGPMSKDRDPNPTIQDMGSIEVGATFVRGGSAIYLETIYDLVAGNGFAGTSPPPPTEGDLRTQEQDTVVHEIGHALHAEHSSRDSGGGVTRIGETPSVPSRYTNWAIRAIRTTVMPLGR